MNPSDNPGNVLPDYTLLRQSLITHAIGRLERFLGPSLARDVAAGIADAVLDQDYVTVLDGELAKLRRMLADIVYNPDPAKVHHWQAGDTAAWRGRAVTVVSPPGEVLVELPHGGTTNTDPDDLTPYTDR